MSIRAHLQQAQLHLRHPGLTQTEYDIWDRDQHRALLLDWNTPDERQLAAWANATEATEAGTVGLVLLALEACTGLVAVRRAETRTGADYYVGPPGTGREDLEHCLRLEISGVDQGSSSTIYRRLAEKIEQAIRGESNLPALVGVVGFKMRLVVLEPVEDE